MPSIHSYCMLLRTLVPVSVCQVIIELQDDLVSDDVD